MPSGPRGVVPGGNKDDDMDHQLTQQRAIDALQRDLCAARADTLRAREERDKARGEHSRLSGLADGRGYQVEKLETVVDALLAACGAARDAIASLPADALGEGRDGEMVWPLRDELLDHLNKSVAKARGEG